jgi:hypothetical protein
MFEGLTPDLIQATIYVGISHPELFKNDAIHSFPVEQKEELARIAENIREAEENKSRLFISFFEQMKCFQYELSMTSVQLSAGDSVEDLHILQNELCCNDVMEYLRLPCAIYSNVKVKMKNVSPIYSLMCDCLYNLQTVYDEIEKEIKPRIKELKKNGSKDKRLVVINICAQLSTNIYFRMDIMKDAIKHVLGDSILEEENETKQD